MMYSIIILKQDTWKSSLDEQISIFHIFSRLSPLFWNIFANPPKQHVWWPLRWPLVTSSCSEHFPVQRAAADGINH